MRVLWVSNIIFPDFARDIGVSVPLAGGWMFGMAKRLVDEGIQLTVVNAARSGQMLKRTLSKITYYQLVGKKEPVVLDPEWDRQWKKVIAEKKPDLVHIHGTEYALGLSLLKLFPHLNYVVSVQGLASAIGQNYMAGIAKDEVRKSITLRDIIKRNTMLDAQAKYVASGKFIEREYFEKIPNVIGRTNWDHDQVLLLNPKIKYHFCNETLRAAFYRAEKWNSQKIAVHSIFLSQASYPLKGLHKVLEAVKSLQSTYPQLRIRIAGKDITMCSGGFMAKLKMSGYGKYIKKLIHRWDLKDFIRFTGPLSADQMIAEYLKCHVFVCPSSMENSPNSLGEAQLLGVPCVASKVGGIPDMVTHNSTGLLYPFNRADTLALHLQTIFENAKLAQQLSRNGIEVATKRHDMGTNCRDLMSIYNKLLKH